MNRLMQRRGSRTVAAMALTCVLVLIALSMLSLAPSGLVRTARADGAPAEARKDHDNDYILAQVAKLHELHALLHESGSGNGDPVIRAQHLALLGELYAENATFTLPNGQVIKGRAAIVAFFAGTVMYNQDLLSMTVAFRTSFDVDKDGDSAQVSLECHWVDPATGAFVVERHLTGTASKIHGTWMFQDVTGAPASL